MQVANCKGYHDQLNTSQRLEKLTEGTHVFFLRVSKKDHVTCQIRNRKRSMDFDDSYFEDDSDIRKKEDRKKKTNEEYYPKTCEQEVYPLHDQAVRITSYTCSGLFQLILRDVTTNKMQSKFSSTKRTGCS